MSKTNNDYAFLMIGYETPDIVKTIQKSIDADDLYYEGDDKTKYGLEKETHVTIAPCLDNKTDVEELKRLLPAQDKCTAYVNDISIFRCEDYDVLKLDVISDMLRQLNQKILKQHKSYSEYADNYQPHLTIAYLKKGCADKYVNMHDIIKFIPLTPVEYWFSYVENDKDCNKRFKI